MVEILLLIRMILYKHLKMGMLCVPQPLWEYWQKPEDSVFLQKMDLNPSRNIYLSAHYFLLPCCYKPDLLPSAMEVHQH